MNKYTLKNKYTSNAHFTLGLNYTRIFKLATIQTNNTDSVVKPASKLWTFH